jgi:hypothetical protein
MRKVCIKAEGGAGAGAGPEIEAAGINLGGGAKDNDVEAVGRLA